MQEQHTGVAPDADHSRTLDRRAGPRRVSAEGDVNYERRQQGDRRRKKPGLAALFGAVLAGLETTSAKRKGRTKKS
jgi:hypothetical protein